MIKTLLLEIGAIGLGLTLALLLIFTYIGIRELIFELRMKKVMRFLDTPEGKQKLEDLSDAVSRETGLPKWALFCGADEFGNIIVSPRSPDAHIEQYEMEDENNGRLSCMAALVWITTPAGKSVPCDATPRYYIEKPRVGSKKIVTPNGQVLSCEYTEDPSKATGVGYVPHWATCPYARQFRRKQNG